MKIQPFFLPLAAVVYLTSEGDEVAMAAVEENCCGKSAVDFEIYE